ncbi:hypothetical protein GM387_01295 [Shigella flexneri]|nr:hypothetical protein [Shigella flexneri]
MKSMVGLQMLTQQTLKEYLHYDPETGVFTWLKKSANRTVIGSVAGTPHKRGYIRITIKRKSYMAHDLAILYTEGFLPDRVDHRNGITDDNRRMNLRVCTQAENCWNRKIHSNNTSGVKGVSFNKASQKWRARIMVHGVTHFLGLFDNVDDAKEAIRKKREELHREFTNHGEAYE